MEENKLRHFVNQVRFLLEPELIAYVKEWFPDFIEELAKECLLLKTEGKTREQIVDTLEKEHDETRKFGRLIENEKFPPTWQGISFGGTSFHVGGYWKPPANIFSKVLTLCLDIIAPTPPKLRDLGEDR